MKEPNATLSLFLGTAALPSAFSSGRTSPMITSGDSVIVFFSSLFFIRYDWTLDAVLRFVHAFSLGTNSPPVIKPYITEPLEYLEEGTLTHDSIILQYLPAKVNPMAALHVLQ